MSNIKITDEDLKLINQYTRRGLTEDDIYAFKIVLCDNKVDKDNERFSTAALQELSKLFLWKSGVVDTLNNITSRIYKTSQTNFSK